ncbi:Uncharacterised protein [Vibrio cholerae]|nr:Uncharacterised protein [Vibrio cholerae]CSI64763.1 Uncharacterised protein [Vibrio cholerae]
MPITSFLPCCSHKAKLAKVLAGAVKSIITSNCSTACSRLSTKTIPCLPIPHSSPISTPTNEDSGRSEPAPNSESGFWCVAFTRLRPIRPAAPAIAILTILLSPFSTALRQFQFVDLNYQLSSTLASLTTWPSEEKTT